MNTDVDPDCDTIEELEWELVSEIDGPKGGPGLPTCRSGGVNKLRVT